MSQVEFSRFRNAEKLKTTNVTLLAYVGSEVLPIGVVELQCHLAPRSYKLQIFIVKGTVVSLLGIDACLDMGLVSFCKAMHQLALVPDSTQRIFADYNDLFIDELGKLPVM